MGCGHAGQLWPQGESLLGNLSRLLLVQVPPRFPCGTTRPPPCLDSQHANRPARGVQRRRPRHPHHHHGARAEGPRGARRSRPWAVPRRAPDLRAELHLHRHLLEQPPPHVPAGPACHGGILWANLHLLFWLSLVPFTTAWMDDTRLRAQRRSSSTASTCWARPSPTTSCSCAVFRRDGPDGLLRQAMGRDLKGKLSPASTCSASWVASWLRGSGCWRYVAVAVIWLVPDRRAERFIHDHALED